MKTKTMLTAMAMAIAMTFYACKGDTGAAGPAGSNGTANISNTTFVVTSWSNPTSGWYEASLAVPAITDYNNDDVQCYVQTESNGSWIPIPVVSLLYDGDNMIFSVIPEGVNIFYEYSSAPTSQLSFRVVVIPPTEVAKMKLNNVNLNNYNQVSAYIKLNSK